MRAGLAQRVSCMVKNFFGIIAGHTIRRGHLHQR
jgi:hypothetical protein